MQKPGALVSQLGLEEGPREEEEARARGLQAGETCKVRFVLERALVEGGW